MTQILRSLEVEGSSAGGKRILHFLRDVNQFHESLRISRLAPEHARLGHPQHVLALGLAMHKAPRAPIVGHSACPPITRSFKSILAGCQQSCSWARWLFHRLVETLGFVMRGSICYEHVVDFSQVIASHSKAEMFHAGLAIGRKV